jgi:signal transduction histidine kinase
MLDTASLRKIEALSDLPEEHLKWLAEKGEDLHLETGEILAKEGDTAEHMFGLLEGEIRLRRDTNDGGAQTFDVAAGEITGLLPYSRLKTFFGTIRAITPSRVARFHKQIFPELLQRMPALGERLVGRMLDRVRETTRRDEQQEKLASLGKLAAGLAHELNNPAAAVNRAAKSLVSVREKLRAAYLRIDQRELTTAQRKLIADFEKNALERMKAPELSNNSLEQADREDLLIEWMDAHKVEESYNLASRLVESSVTPVQLDELAQQVGVDALSDVLTRIDLVLLASRLVAEIEIGATRISGLVSSIKKYTYMDQGPEQEVDVHEGIEETLTMIGFRLRKKSISVTRKYDPGLPKICASGAELNQVWTNLFTNAIDAMQDGGQLQIRTWGETRDIFIEVRDDGSGIPKEIESRIFEPFFTTKGVGEGTGLGLDTVQRIVRRHRGEISVESQPGDTRFVVRIPKQKIK